jgi:adenosylcobalamin-dependent ribonucleoside-triphosphate reductase
MKRSGLPRWKALTKSMEKAFDDMFHRRVIPAGRIVWGMGSTALVDSEIADLLYNCCGIDTGTSSSKLLSSIVFLMMQSMFGCGVGIRISASGEVFIKGQSDGPKRKCIIADTREGWVESTVELISSFIEGHPDIDYVYSKIRAAGAEIKGIGGKASGPSALMELHEFIRATLVKNAGSMLTTRTLCDIINYIGKAVCAGNLRRNAIIIIGSADDKQFLELKDYQLNPERAAYGWTSNNSVIAGDFTELAEALKKTTDFGEPGFLFLDNIRRYGRLCDPDNNDVLVIVINPCGEQPLEDGEVCCLVEAFPSNCADRAQFCDSMSSAVFFGKGVMLCQSLWPLTNAAIAKNRRIGIGLAGVFDFMAKFAKDSADQETLKDWCRVGYVAAKKADVGISKVFGVRQSSRLTTVKPGGTIPVVGGALSGVTPAHSKYIMNNIRLAATSELVQEYRDCGYKVEPDVTDPTRRVVVSFPVSYGEGVLTMDEIDASKQLDFVVLLQKYWSDNAVSCSITFTEEEQKLLPSLAERARKSCKSISFMPRSCSQYPQLPKEPISEERYRAEVARIRRRPDYTALAKRKDIQHADATPVMGCDGDRCAYPV